MDNYSFYSYLSASVGYGVLFFLVLYNFRKKQIIFPFVLAVSLSLIWAVFSVVIIYYPRLYSFNVMPIETLRNAGWFFLLSVLISKQQFDDPYLLLKHYWQPRVMSVIIFFVCCVEFSPVVNTFVQSLLAVDIRLFAHIGFSIIGLMLVEQLYRNALAEQRWNIKFLCISLAAVFIFDFIIYSKSALFLQLDERLWYSRGFVHFFLAPLLVISFHRFDAESSGLIVSNKVVFHTTVLVGSGIYLILMSLAGFYIRDYGGNWGEIAEVIFIFLAILFLTVFFVSGKVRALSKVYFSKHFFQHRYNYRDEWLKLSRSIAQLNSINDVSGFIVKTMANLVDSSGGGLWLKNDYGDYYLASDFNLGFESMQLIHGNDSLINFIKDKKWVIDFVEFFNDPDIYSDVKLDDWYSNDKNVWLIVPLFRLNDLEAFVVLTNARVVRQIDWEDHDLLKTVGMQLANALALVRASDDLSRSRQFEAYNRLSAFLVHDLKNLVAQISLIVKNSAKHKHNPDFIDDSIATLENVVSKVQRILGQLKQGESRQAANFKKLNLIPLIRDVESLQKHNKPILDVNLSCEQCFVLGDEEKLSAILAHLIQNAQEATSDDGYVRLDVKVIADEVVVSISDNGCGMDKAFIEQRLFKPFDTTKGNAGMGIGVYEAREYMLQHSGRIFVESQLGLGTIFTLKFPVSE